MSEIKKVATRDSYGNALVELGKEHDDLIVLDADLAGATKTGMFKKAFPERHWDIGKMCIRDRYGTGKSEIENKKRVSFAMSLS